MKSTALAFFAAVLLTAPALAQDAGSAAPMAGGDAGGGKGGKMKAAMSACKTEVQSQGVKGAERKKAMMDCISKEHPEMAGRVQCRMDGKAKGLSGDDLKSFIKTCAKGKA